MNYGLQILLIALFFGGIGVWISHNKKSTQTRIDESTIIVGTNAEYPPFCFIEDGEIVGFDIDIAREVVNRLGKKMALKDMPFDALLPDIQLGNIHIIAAGSSPSPEREGQVFFSKTYLTGDPLVIITRADQATLNTVQDLNSKDVIVNDGFTADLYLSQFDGPIIKRLPTVAEAFLALTSKRADAFVSARTAVEPFFEQYDRNKFHITVLPDVTDAYALMISRNYPTLRDEVQKALNTMEQDGTISKLKQKWNLK